MIIYQIALLLHILGALGIFIGLGFEWLCLKRINGTTSHEKLKEWINFLASLKTIFSTSAVALLLSGIYMSIMTWGGAAWIVVSFIGLVTSSINGAVITGKKIEALQKIINTDDSKLPPDIFEQKHNQKLFSHFQLRSAISLSIIFMMTFKPEMTISISAFVLALILGSLPIFSLKKSNSAELAE
jgi:hypothetical protein